MEIKIKNTEFEKALDKYEEDMKKVEDYINLSEKNSSSNRKKGIKIIKEVLEWKAECKLRDAIYTSQEPEKENTGGVLL